MQPYFKKLLMSEFRKWLCEGLKKLEAIIPVTGYEDAVNYGSIYSMSIALMTYDNLRTKNKIMKAFIGRLKEDVASLKAGQEYPFHFAKINSDWFEVVGLYDGERISVVQNLVEFIRYIEITDPVITDPARQEKKEPARLKIVVSYQPGIVYNVYADMSDWPADFITESARNNKHEYWREYNGTQLFKKDLCHIHMPEPAQPGRPAIDGDDPVNHPSHYGGDTIYEVIKVIAAWGLDFPLGNAVKYIARAGKKDKAKELEDLKKAQFYINHKIESLQQ